MNTRENRFHKGLSIFFLVTGIMLCNFGPALAQDPGVDGFTWSESAGWINFNPAHGGVTVHDTHLSGYAWAENIGWVKMGVDGGGPYGKSGSTDWGVNRGASGGLSGYAWSEVAGWINFNPTHSRVIIDPVSSALEHYGWSENIGWIHFSNHGFYGAVARAAAGTLNVPTMNEWGMIAFMLLLGAFSIWMIKKREFIAGR